MWLSSELVLGEVFCGSRCICSCALLFDRSFIGDRLSVMP